MNILSKSIAFSFIVMLMMSCGHNSDHSQEHEHENEQTNSEESSEHEHKSEGVSLDNGNLWQANPETTTGINNMILIMQDFNGEGTESDYGTLLESLKTEFNMIFEKCTMTGEAHNQLHNYLVPINALFEGLESEDETAQKEAFDKLNMHLNEYQNFFES